MWFKLRISHLQIFYLDHPFARSTGLTADYTQTPNLAKKWASKQKNHWNESGWWVKLCLKLELRFELLSPDPVVKA